MKKIVKVLCLGAMLIGTAANAQFRQSVYLNGNIPTGDFASDASNGPTLIAAYNTGVPLTYEQIGKDATLGFGLGYRVSYRFDVGYGMVAPFVQADFFWNSISSSLSSEYRSARADATPTYINVPVQLGVSYLYDQLWNDITPYAEFGIGVDGMFITSEGPCHWTTLTGSTVNSAKYSYDPSFAVAFSFGLGAYFGRHVSAGLYYYGLGQHTINYTKKTIDEGLTDIPLASQRNYFLANPTSRSVGSFALRIGFHF